MSTPSEDRDRVQRARRAVLGSRMRQARMGRNLSQESLASRARVDRSFLAEVELGQASPRVDWLWDVATALGVTPADLLADARDQRSSS